MKIMLIVALLLVSGCAWQGQRYTDGDVTDEWWSMRFCWMSGGVEAYTKSDHYESGAKMAESKSDPNAIGSVVDGVIEGLSNTLIPIP